MKLLSFFFIMSFLLCLEIKAQEDSLTYQINPLLQRKEVIIYAPYFTEGISQIRWDTNNLESYATQSWGNLLKKESLIFVKEYGAGLLSTISYRGSNAAQTGMSWDGINIQNPMLGMSDLSLVPVFFFDESTWYQNSAASSMATQSSGGHLNLMTNLLFDQGFSYKAQVHIGSFGLQRYQFSSSYSNKLFATNLRAFYLKTKNDYEYTDVNALGNPKPKIKLSHADQESWGALLQNGIRWKKWNLKLQNWYTQSQRNIPPNLLQTTGDNEKQKDIQIRNKMSWDQRGEKISLHFQLGHLFDLINYESNVIQNESILNQFIFQSRYNQQLTNRYQLGLDLDMQYQTVNSDNYNARRLLGSLGIHHKFNWKGWILNASSRFQYFENSILRPSVGINLSKGFQTNEKNRIQISLASSYNYRFPTLNDLYWRPGGNKNLLTEYSFSNDVKFKINSEYHAQWKGETECSLYGQHTENWIQWTAQGSIFTPQNIAEVLNYGLESSYKLSYQTKDQQLFTLKIAYGFTKSIRYKDKDTELNMKQLAYTPLHKAIANLSWTWKKMFFIQLDYQWQGKRFVDDLNTIELSDFHLANFQIRYKLPIKFLDIEAGFEIQNIFNSEYQVIANRPMPGRAFYTTLTFLY
jgi:vitamin B12 transporter